MVQSFIELVVPLATYSSMTCYLQNKLIHFQNWKRRAMDVSRDSTKNIMSDK